jgi:hypothetical protein
MTAKIQVRRDTTTNWNAGTPPTLDVGEIGLDTTLKQIKIGDGSSNWTALPWLGGTLPYFSSPNANIDDASLRVPGVYRWAGIASITSGTVPAAPIDIKVADGGINMLVLAFGSVVLQHLWTDGDGTQPQKSLTRIYDSTYRAWTPQNIWGVSATEGVDVVAKSITLKDTATGLTVDGNGVFTGIISASAGTAAAPAITTTGDTDTGIYFPAANQLAVTAAGVQQLLLNSGAADVLSAVFRKGATFNERVDMNAFRVIDVGDAVQLTDAINWQTLLANIAIVVTASNGAVTASNGTSWNVANIATQVTLTPNPSVGALYDGMVLSFAGGGNLNTGLSKHFNSTAVPTSNAGATGMVVMVAIKRS